MGVAQMPLAKYRGRITFLLHELAHRHLLRMDTIIRVRSGSASETDPVRIATGQQPRTRGATNRLASQKMGKPNALRGQGVYIRSRVAIGTITRKITKTHIIQIDQDNICRAFHRIEGRTRHQCRKQHDFLHNTNF